MLRIEKLELLKNGLIARKKQNESVQNSMSMNSYTKDFHTESRNLKGAESRAKSSVGLLSSTLENLSVLSSSISGVPLVGNYAKAVGSVSKPMTSISRMLGLSKPMTQDVSAAITINNLYDVNYGMGTSGAMKVSLDPENAISTEPNIAGVSEDEMTLKHIVGTPSMIYTLPFTNLTMSTAIGSTFIEATSSYVDFVSNSFAFYAGSYKFKIYITASLFHNVRMVFFLADPTYGTDWTSCYHRIVDVKGDCEVELMIPYTFFKPMIGSSNSGFNIMASVLAWSAPNPSLSLPIYLNVYKAGGSDFKFGGLMDNAFTCSSRNLDDFHCQSNPREDFNKNFEPIHPSCTGYSVDNMVMGEEITTLRQILHRYHPYYLTNASGNNPIWAVTPRASGSIFNGLEYWGLLFRFWRGSIRMKYIQNLQKLDGSVIMKRNGSTMSGVIMNLSTPGASTSVIQCEIPYYNNELMCDCQVIATSAINLYYDNQVRFLLKSAGDDFSFHFLCGINNLGTFSNWSSTSTTKGLLGLQDYLDV